MNTKHTPGPWKTYRYSDSQNAPLWTVGTVGGERVADNIERGKPQDEAKANAALIAAAPDLLAAAEFYVSNCPQRSHPSHDLVCDGPMCRTFRAAIAKAEGV